MKKLPLQKRTLALVAVIIPLLVLFIYVAFRSGPLAPVSVVLTTVENKSLSPALFGIGTVEARYTYKIGPTVAGRVKHLDIHVGDHVKAEQVLGEIDSVDLDKLIQAKNAAVRRTKAQLNESQAHKDYAQNQVVRYEKLFKVHSVSEELLATKKQELRIAQTGLIAAREELSRIGIEREALQAQRNNLYLIAPVDGLVVSRNVNPGTTVVAGQPVVELIDPNTLWANVRLDQIRSEGISDGLLAKITLRSQGGEFQAGRVLRVEPLADAVTEETLVKVVFDQIPTPLPPIGELVEVTIALPVLAPAPVIPNAAIHHIDGRLGVWQFINGDLRFIFVSLGRTDLEGQVQVLAGLNIGDQVVLYSENLLHENSRINVVDHIQGAR